MQKVESLLPAASARLRVVSPDSLLVEAAQLLNEPGIQLVIICGADGRMTGVVTQTDIVAHIGTCTGHSCMMAVSGVMSREVATCRGDDWLEDAWAAMKARGLRNLPIVDAVGKPLGVLTARETVQHLLEDSRYEENLLRDYVMNIGYH